ncbi:hypothetical protein XarjCFBP7645_02820 [Xanthomonas arboricola]|uniref:Uncharacterized protein n=1 Tax=Xanthomonas arboricola TaxID=56448 RepID=A0A2S7AH95_9XANT|nr:hypothetical protein XarjCFBP7645_02820 [Xanthomonas arboricola]
MLRPALIAAFACGCIANKIQQRGAGCAQRARQRQASAIDATPQRGRLPLRAARPPRRQRND